MTGAAFSLRPVQPELIGGTAREAAAVVELRGASVASDHVVSIDDNYFVSFGAHVDATTLLIQRRGAKPPLTIERSMELCALVSYALDSPVVPVHRPGSYGASNRAVHSRAFRGLLRGGLEDYLERLGTLAEDLDGVFGPPPFRRKPPYSLSVMTPSAPGKWAYLSEPKNAVTRRMLTVYWSGLLSLPAPARLLNFWRVFEALTPKGQRNSFYTSLSTASCEPVWAVAFGQPARRSRINLMARLRRAALAHQRRLRTRYGRDEDALDFIYWMRRGKAAHADTAAVEFDQLRDLAEVVRDAEMVRYMARVALEASWA